MASCKSQIHGLQANTLLDRYAQQVFWLHATRSPLRALSLGDTMTVYGLGDWKRASA